MKRKPFPSVFLICFSAIILFSCKQNREIIPSADFAPYISAYTGGAISSQSPVRIEFTQDLPMVELNSEVKENLFSFSPSIKGKTYWINNRCIEFVPDSGQLKGGTLYNAEFELDKVMQIDERLAKFAFSFRVIKQSFALEASSYTVFSDHPETAVIEGEIRFSDDISPEDVKKMLNFNYPGNPSFSPKIEATPDPKSYRFTVENIVRGESDQHLEITADGKSIGVDYKTSIEVLVPSKIPFRILSAGMISLPENGVEIIFSDPVSTSQDLRGLIEIPGISDYVLQVEQNKVKIFFERNELNTISLNIDQAVQNYSGHKLGSTSSLSLSVESLKPQIEFFNAGTILPDSKNLILPFKAVNLWAVDLKIIRIFEQNVPMFMQSNALPGFKDLRRAGRLIHKETVRLNTDPSKKLSRWNNFSIDLAKIINQEPGAIYRIEMTFKKEYSLYSCGGETLARGQSEGLSSLSGNHGVTDEDNAIWDEPQTYYWSGNNDINWDEYNWKDRDNPCKPSYYMISDNTFAACNVFASNMGLIIKRNQDNKLWVAVNDILSTLPIEGVEVKAYNFQLQQTGSAKTDANGFAEIEPKGKPFMVVAEKGKEKAYLRVVDGEENSLTRFDVSGEEIQKGLKGFLFGERGVWRPGDTLHLSFILEDKVKRIPQNHPVSLEIYNPKGQFYTKQISTQGINGFYTFTVATNPDDPTGIWSAYVKIGGVAFHKSLRIETVKPNRLKVNLEIPGNRMESIKETVTATLSSAWLTGAIARNLKATVEMNLSKVNTQFKGYEKYTFNNPATSFNTETIQLFEGILNEEGVVKFDIKIPKANNAPGMLQANFISRVFEPGGDVSTYVQSMPFSPFSTYVGLNTNRKENEYYLETDKEYVFDIVTLTSEGKPVNRQNLDFRVYRVNWSWWWEDRNESFESYINNASVTPVKSEILSTAGGKTSVKFRIDYPEWGRYLIYIKDKESGHATGDLVFVDWPSWRGRSSKSDPSGLSMLSFSTDKKSYEVGEEVTVIVPAASKGKALVALENGSSVLKREWVDVAEGKDTRYTFRVTEEMAPNFYIHISLLQPHAQTINDLPIRMYGVVPVEVSNKDSRLYPEISLPELLRPEKEFTLSVKERSGKPMTYVVAIVDEGLLDLTAFKTPDPWNSFYAREAIGIKTWDMYDYVVGAFGSNFSPLFSIGGDETMKPANQKANRFRPVTKFLGPFALKKGATATHKIQLPMYVGSIRAMVIAAENGRYGNAEKAVPVRSPLMVLSTLPRVISAGEEIVLPVNVFAMEDKVKSATVKVETSGLTKVTSDGAQTLKFAKPGDESAYFTLKAGNQTGVEKIKVTASGNGETATETIEIDIRNPNPSIVKNVNKYLRPAEEADFEYHLANNSDENWVKLEVSRIPSVDINRRFDYLINYQHYCSEQVTSRAFPMLYIDQFKNLSQQEHATIRKNVREAIQTLYLRQLPNGGFAYWPGNTYAYDWVTSYAGHFLCEAQRKGYEVNQNVINNWKSYQRKLAQNWSYNRNHPNSRYYYSQNDLDQAYRLYTLALTGSPEIGAMNRLKELKNLSEQASWRLAAAYAANGKKKAANELVFNTKTTVDPYSSNNPTYGSSYRDEAMILETLVLMDNMQKAFEQAQKVSRNLSSEYYFSTQSTSYALLAMGKLAEKSEKGMVEAEWSLNGKPGKEIQSVMAVNQIDIPSDVLSGNLKLKNKGKGDLFVSFTTKSQPVNDSLPAIANNLRVDVRYTDLDGRPVGVNRLPQSTDFIASVTVGNISGTENYTDLALTHIMPSGWEIFNERMMSAEDNGSGPVNYTYRDIRDDRVLTYFDLRSGHTINFKIRLQAAYIGKYILPAVLCEAMYDTGAQARTQSGWVEVVK